jgi:hypothetical protein
LVKPQDELRRFDLIEDGGPDPHDLRAYRCSPCSNALAHPFGLLVQYRVGAVEENGRRTSGALCWSCPRCFTSKFKIRRLAG